MTDQDLAPCGSDDEGNSKSSSSSTKRPAASKKWIFTWNNFKCNDVQWLKDTLAPMSTYGFENEIAPSTGTPHLQGWVEFHDKVRPMECIKPLKYEKYPIRWFKMKGKIEDNITYCSKDSQKEIYVKYYTNKIEKPKRKSIIDPMESLTFKDWQNEIMDIIKTEPDFRTVNWFWEPEGKTGKSTFTRHLVLKYKALAVSGKGNDVKFILSEYLANNDLEIIIWDLSRSYEQYVSYSTMEEIKNGLICSGKYESKSLVFNPPHLIVFANFPPDTEKLSKDRWNIKNIKN